MIIRKNRNRSNTLVNVPRVFPIQITNISADKELYESLRPNTMGMKEQTALLSPQNLINSPPSTNNANSQIQSRSLALVDSQLWNTDILTDKILRQTEILIQRNILHHKDIEPSSKTLGQDQDRKMIRQIQETCKIQGSFKQQNTFPLERRTNSMMESLILPQNQFEQENILYHRQQAVLQKFYKQTQLNQGIEMSEKLQNCIASKQVFYGQNTLSTKDAKLLELFSALGDDKQHEKLLEQSLLLDFFLQDKKDLTDQIFKQNSQPKTYNQRRKQIKGQNKAELEKWLLLHQDNQVRMKVRGIDEIGNKNNRKYYSQQHDESKKKKSEERQENMANITQKTNQYKINIVRQFIKNDLQLKKKENIQVIDYLMDFNPKIVPNEIKDSIFQRAMFSQADVKLEIAVSQIRTSEKSTIETLPQSQIIQILRKCFFRYSNKDEADFSRIYREMHQNKLVEFLKVMGITPGIVEIQYVLDVSSKIMKNKLIKVLNFEEFVELIRKVAYQFCISNKPSKFVSKRRKNVLKVGAIPIIKDDQSIQLTNETPKEDIKIDHKQALIQFGLEVLVEREVSMLDPLEFEIRQNRSMKLFLKKFEPIQEALFVFSFELKGVTGVIPNFLKFDDIFELLWRIDLFPRLIAKSTIRHYFYYMLNNIEGLDQEYFGHFITLIGLSILRSQSNRLQLIHQVVKERKDPILSHIITYFRTMDRINKNTINLMAEIGLFYLDAMFLDSVNLQRKMETMIIERNKSCS